MKRHWRVLLASITLAIILLAVVRGVSHRIDDSRRLQALDASPARTFGQRSQPQDRRGTKRKKAKK